jgi:hypothetical protein
MLRRIDVVSIGTVLFIYLCEVVPDGTTVRGNSGSCERTTPCPRLSQSCSIGQHMAAGGMFVHINGYTSTHWFAPNWMVTDGKNGRGTM